MIDYKNGKIYQVVCNITGERYIGSTARSVEDRLIEHEKSTNRCCSKQIIERGDYYIELLETYPCESEFELNRKEGEYQKSIECINLYVAGRTGKELREDNKERYKITKKEWTIKNFERIKARKKEYTIKNAERIKARNKEYEIKNAERIKAYNSQIVICECGCKGCKGSIAQHKRSKKHIDLMNKLTSPSNDLLDEEKVLVC